MNNTDAFKKAVKRLMIPLLAAVLIIEGVFLFNDFKEKRADFNTRVAPGVLLDGERVEGLTLKELDAFMAGKVKAMNAPIQVEVSTTGTETVSIDMESIDLSSNVATLTPQIMAYGHNKDSESLSAAISDFKKIYLNPEWKTENFTIEWAFNSKKLSSELDTIAKKYGKSPQDAKISFDGKLSVVQDSPGFTIDKDALQKDIEKNVLNPEQRKFYAAVKAVKPKILSKDLPRVIVVSKSARRFKLYENTGKVIKEYRCAIGAPGFPTPEGDFKIISKQYMAPWINPGSAWASGMPKSIPAGPYNPMGVHKLGIGDGIYFHGIPPSEFSSIGHAASHGCMRMLPKDVKDLYGRVEVGTLVFIR